MEYLAWTGKTGSELEVEVGALGAIREKIKQQQRYEWNVKRIMPIAGF